MTYTAADFKTPNASQSDIAALNAALTYLQKSQTGADIVSKMVAAGTTINMTPGNDEYVGNNTINWNPAQALAVTDQSGLVNIGVQSAAVNLAHEGAHLTDPDLMANTAIKNVPPDFPDAAEQYAVNRANKVATELGEVQRTLYNQGVVDLSNATEHTVSKDNGTLAWSEDVLNGAATVTGGSMAVGDVPTSGGALSVPVSGNAITVNNATVSIAGGAQATVNGTGNTISLGNGSNASVVSSGSNTLACGQSTVTTTGNSTATCTNGNLDTKNLNGDGSLRSEVDISPSNSADNINASGQGAVINTNNANVTLADNSNATVNGSSNTINVGRVANLTGNGTGNTIAASSSDNVTLTGSANVVNTSGTGVEVTASNASINVASGATATLNGNGNVVSVGTGDSLSVTGGADTVNANGTGNQITIGGNGQNATAANTDQVNFVTGQGNSVTELANSLISGNVSSATVTVSGAASAILTGTGGTVNLGNGASLTLGDGSNMSVNGTGTVINVGNNDTVVVGAGGGSNNVNLIGGHSTITDNASQDLLNIAGSSENVTASGGTQSITDSGSHNSIVATGNGQTISDSGNNNYVYVQASATNANVQMSGTGASGYDYGVNLDNAGSHTTATLAGSGEIGQSWGNYDKLISAGANDTAVMWGGSHNFLEATAASDTLRDYGNNDYTYVTASSTNANVVVTGTGASDYDYGTNLDIGGSNATVTMTGSGEIAQAWGTHERIDSEAAQQTIVVDGGGHDYVDVKSDSDKVRDYGNNDYDYVTASATNADVALYGTGASDYDYGVNADIGGNHETVTLGGAGEVAQAWGNNDRVDATANQDVVAVSGGAGDYISASADSDRVNDAGSGDYDYVMAAATNASVTVSGSGPSNYDYGVNVDVGGSHSTIYMQGQHEEAQTWGNNEAINSSQAGNVIQVDSGSSGIAISASNDTIHAGGSDSIVVNGSNDTETEASGSSIVDNGTGDSVNGTSVASGQDAIDNAGNITVSQAGSGSSGSTCTTGHYVSEVTGYTEEVVGVDEDGDPIIESVPVTTEVYVSDPVILNLQGQRVQTTALQGSQASFDMENTGHALQTGWGIAGEGYLVFDPNDASNSTQVTQDSQLVAGFGALQALAVKTDGTCDGSLNGEDALWRDLKVWVDTAGTGQFQSGQLYSLDQLGITGIQIDASHVGLENNGNTILDDSTFTMSNGTIGDIAGVNLVYSASSASSAADQLVQAMASFAPAAAAQVNPLAVSNPTANTPLLAVAH